eukprot:GHVS01079754.1.p1 GENE.GHVS01079754.1~~GHVS01079754.1.p1  ORF type:complete len:624 (+),score=197.04 GHVS01079754.1:78-1949(+)
MPPRRAPPSPSSSPSCSSSQVSPLSSTSFHSPCETDTIEQQEEQMVDCEEDASDEELSGEVVEKVLEERMERGGTTAGNDTNQTSRQQLRKCREGRGDEKAIAETADGTVSGHESEGAEIMPQQTRQEGGAGGRRRLPRRGSLLQGDKIIAQDEHDHLEMADEEGLSAERNNRTKEEEEDESSSVGLDDDIDFMEDFPEVRKRHEERKLLEQRDEVDGGEGLWRSEGGEHADDDQRVDQLTDEEEEQNGNIIRKQISTVVVQKEDDKNNDNNVVVEQQQNDTFEFGVDVGGVFVDAIEVEQQQQQALVVDGGATQHVTAAEQVVDKTQQSKSQDIVRVVEDGDGRMDEGDKIIVTQQPINSKRLMIEKVVLDNFKSYGGKKTIGPFHKRFTAVVGPNGSGKSNVIDGMLFVFGRRAKDLRQTKVAELIHKSLATTTTTQNTNTTTRGSTTTSENRTSKSGATTNAGFTDLVDESDEGESSDDAKTSRRATKRKKKMEDPTRRATVAVHFQEIVDDTKSSDLFEVVPGSRLVVAREARGDGSSRYMVNSKVCSHAEVVRVLKEKGVNLEHNRFLILQGEVEMIAQMKPKAMKPDEEGLLEYLEEIIGSNMFVFMHAYMHMSVRL